MSIDKQVLDSGERRGFSTGSQRDKADGKGMPSLLQFMALMNVSKVCESGAVKYRPRNWELGQPCSTYLDSGLRHLFKFILNWQDEPHLSQANWNFLCLHETKIRCALGMLPTELDDIPSTFLKDTNMIEMLKKFEENPNALFF